MKWLARRGRPRRVLPGFRLSLGVVLFALSGIVLLPLAMLVARVQGMGWTEFAASAFSPRALAAYRLSFGAALLAAAINVVAGGLVAWVLVRYRFPGRRLVHGLIDLPFALPTAVAGIALTALYAPGGWVGRLLAPLGVEVAYSRIGVVVALVVRTVEPVLEQVGPELEEAGAVLGAGRLRVFTRVILPLVRPALLTGFALAFARGVGEYGSVIFIAGNLPMSTEIAPLLIVTRLEEYDYEGAAALAIVLLGLSLLSLLAITALHSRVQRASGRSA